MKPARSYVIVEMKNKRKESNRCPREREIAEREISSPFLNAYLVTYSPISVLQLESQFAASANVQLTSKLPSTKICYLVLCLSSTDMPFIALWEIVLTLLDVQSLQLVLNLSSRDFVCPMLSLFERTLILRSQEAEFSCFPRSIPLIISAILPRFPSLW